jgi:hypothetical protein
LNQLDKAIERILEDLVERYRKLLQMAEESLEEFRRHHRRHILTRIAIRIQIHKITIKEFVENMATNPGGVTLTTAGQQATARILYFDQNGAPMPSDFKAPAVQFDVDDKTGAVAKVVDNGDGTATVTAVGDGSEKLSATVAGPDGELSDSVDVVVSGVTPPPPPPEPVLTSIKIGFDQ